MDISILNNEQFGKLNFKIREDVVYRNVDDEMIIMDMVSGRYSGLNETGARIWTLLSEHNNIARVLDILKDEYAISNDSFSEDVKEFIQSLLDQKLIEVIDVEQTA